jgi:hypothetical protein
MEASITVNGIPLTMSQSMTVRVALATFALDLQSERGLGDDEHGKAMVNGYMSAIRAIHQMMYPTDPEPRDD